MNIGHERKLVEWTRGKQEMSRWVTGAQRDERAGVERLRDEVSSWSRLSFRLHVLRCWNIYIYMAGAGIIGGRKK